MEFTKLEWVTILNALEDSIDREYESSLQLFKCRKFALDIRYCKPDNEKLYNLKLHTYHKLLDFMRINYDFVEIKPEQINWGRRFKK